MLKKRSRRSWVTIMTSIKKINPSPFMTAHPDNEIDLQRVKQELLEKRIREARKLAFRIILLLDGRRLIRRFTLSESYQHLTLLISFALLAFTGLLQTYSAYAPVAAVINFFGGVDDLRTVHRVAAIALIAVSIYHAWQILETWFVKREKGAMWPRVKDFHDFVQMILYNLDRRPDPPKFDRFSFDEKIEYWALIWGQIVMIATGIIMWFPLSTTKLLPGEAIPIARALHRWEAILAVLSILIWHMYHTQIKTRNTSIFTGYMSEDEMTHDHPLEYERIISAYEFLMQVQPQTLIRPLHHQGEPSFAEAPDQRKVESATASSSTGDDLHVAGAPEQPKTEVKV